MEGGSVWWGPNNFISLQAPKGHNSALVISVEMEIWTAWNSIVCPEAKPKGVQAYLKGVQISIFMYMNVDSKFILRFSLNQMLYDFNWNKRKSTSFLIIRLKFVRNLKNLDTLAKV